MQIETLIDKQMLKKEYDFAVNLLEKYSKTLFAKSSLINCVVIKLFSIYISFRIKKIVK